MMMMSSFDNIKSVRRRKMNFDQFNNSKQKKKISPNRRLIARLAAFALGLALLAGQLVTGQHLQASTGEPPAQSHQADLELNSNNKHQQGQQHSTLISTLLAGEHNDQQAGGASSGSINLIPVDQPVGAHKAAELPPPSPPVAESRIRADFEQTEPAAFAGDQSEETDETQYEPAPQPPTPDNDIKPAPQFHVSSNLDQDSGQSTAGHQISVERRFGLIKSKLGSFGHYAAPQMSANYAYMSDACERCLASMNQQQQQSADLQEAPPAPQPIPVPVPLPMPMPANQPIGFAHHQQQHQHQQTHPLKSKLLMKFPFFMKPSMFGAASDYGLHSTSSIAATPNYSGASHSLPLMSDYGTSAAAYWNAPTNQQLYQPSRAPAIYLRPASAYNCIQTTPPLYAAASNNLQQQVEQQINISSIGQPSKTAKSPAAAIKQQQQPFQHQHQQQQQTGY